MRIRWKILVVLLSISMVPMLATRWNSNRITHSLARELGEQTRNALVRQSTQALKRLVEDHARLLKREGDLVEMVLAVQSAKLEKLLADPVQLNQMAMPLDGMAAVYDADDREFPGLFLWQIMVLENGVQRVYPESAGDPVYDGRETPWYRLVKKMNSIAWDVPVPDPLTGQIVFPVAVPIHGAGGVFLGASAGMIPVSWVLNENEHIRMISQNVVSLLVRAKPRSEYGSTSNEIGIQVIASEHEEPSYHERWHYLQTARWLSSDTPDALAPVISDLMNRRSGINDVPYDGRATLMAYSVISAEGTSLLLIVPKSDLIADAEGLERYVQVRFIEEMKTTGTILSGVLLGVFMLSIVLSRYVTTNIRKLLEGSRRLATGDFSTRIDIRSRDEIGELGRAFNRMVPDLEERIRLKQGIDVASNVQMSLLPKGPPDLTGMDIAAVSLYCDETGGDFYDFIAVNRGGRPGIGIAVGDVSGHGISAALLMATARAFLKGRMAQSGSLPEIIGDVNRLLCRDTDNTGQFLTLFYMELASGADAVDWVRAGHDPGLLYDPKSDAFSELKGEGAALGIDADMIYSENHQSELKFDQIIAVGTDGIWESRNSAGEMFGKERFKAAIRTHGSKTAREIVDGIVSELNTFREAGLQSDDVTLVVVKRRRL